MHTRLLPILRCPASGGALLLEAPNQDWIDEGLLISVETGRRYPIQAGIPHLYIDDECWQPKAREARGWVQLFQDTGGFERDDGDLLWPYYDQQPWIDIARQFDIMLTHTNPCAGDWVLDLGAGRGWAAKHFALRGCHTVAVDVVADSVVGLGRSRALMEHTNVAFDPIIADGENLPLINDHFDLVFCSATLHHATDLRMLLSNILRVLRPGGRLAAINEPCIADATDDEQLWRSPELARELSYGINETRPRLKEYRQVLRDVGFQEEAIFPWNAHGLEMHHLATWSTQLGIMPPEQLHAAQSRRDGARWKHWFRQRTEQPTEDQLRRGWCDYMMQQCGGGIIIFAKKAESSRPRRGDDIQYVELYHEQPYQPSIVFTSRAQDRSVSDAPDPPPARRRPPSDGVSTS